MSSDLPQDRRFDALRTLTQARIGLRRAGHAVATAPMLDFQHAHARARAAVLQPLDTGGLVAALGDSTSTHLVRSRAETREVYLQRPDLGRRLDPRDAIGLNGGPFDAVIVIADGLSAEAVQKHAAPTVSALRQRLAGWRLGPTVIALQARVAIGDEIGEVLGAQQVILFVGERPGLSSADSLGAYLTYMPALGRRDHERNCVSNIRPPDGLAYAEAGDRIAWLMCAARRLGMTGVGLKDDFSPPLEAMPIFPPLEAAPPRGQVRALPTAPCDDRKS